jgi:hypothetical protein
VGFGTLAGGLIDRAIVYVAKGSWKLGEEPTLSRNGLGVGD